MQTLVLNDVNIESKYNLLMTEELVYPVSEAMIFQEQITGRPGVLDYTSYYGDVVKGPKVFTPSFNSTQFNDNMIEELENRFNGREVKMIDTKKPQFYWLGRCKVLQNFKNNGVWFVDLEITCYPNKYRCYDNSEVV